MRFGNKSRLGLGFLVVGTFACGSAQVPPVANPEPSITVVQPGAGPSAQTEPASGDDETVLNAKRWKYASYFNRLKRRVGAAWDPTGVWKALPEVQRTSLGTTARETRVGVELSADGTITKLEIRKSSGVAELDAEAIRAFQVSSPFGAIPDGQPLKPFSFGFQFEIPSGTSSTVVVP